MLASSRETLLARLAEDDLVLDVGGGFAPLARADWVLDVVGYDERRASEGERFTRETWVRGDACDHEPWPFEDDRFDFAVCSHTLEDVRDPVRVCAELQRVARAGYIEVPSRLEEQSWGVIGPWAGWSHHRWLVDVGERSIHFVFKPHAIHGDEALHFPPGFHDSLSDTERVQRLWWQGSFDFGERIVMDTAELNAYLAEPIRARGGPARGWRARRRLARHVSGG